MLEFTKPWVAVACLVGLAACAESPTAPGAEAAHSETSRSAAICQNVAGSGTFAAAGPGIFAGTLSGDLTGTITIVDEDVLERGSGALHLVSRVTLDTNEFGVVSGQERAVAIPLSPTRFRFEGRLEIEEGGSGFLQISGELDVSGLPVGTFTYRGRLCE